MSFGICGPGLYADQEKEKSKFSSSWGLFHDDTIAD